MMDHSITHDVILHDNWHLLVDMLKFRNSHRVSVHAEATIGGERIVITRVDSIAWSVTRRNSDVEVMCYDTNGTLYRITLHAPRYFRGRAYIVL